jgi:hypothetical protein
MGFANRRFDRLSIDRLTTADDRLTVQLAAVKKLKGGSKHRLVSHQSGPMFSDGGCKGGAYSAGIGDLALHSPSGLWWTEKYWNSSRGMYSIRPILSFGPMAFGSIRRWRGAWWRLFQKVK